MTNELFNRPIGVFDSGLGGLTAVKELRKLLPHEDIVYFGDTGRVPYGTKSRETILRYAQQDVEFLLTCKVKMILAACGTVSSNIPKDFARQLPVPFTGVVEHACDAAVKATKKRHIGIIATPSTIRSGAYEAHIHLIAPDIQVTAAPCSLFVPLVENGYIQQDNPVTRLVAQQYLAPLKQANPDTLILGCTHYPLLAPIISDIMGPEVTLIDSGQTAARYTAQYLQDHAMLCEPCRRGTNRFYVSDSTEGFADVAGIFLGSDIHGEVTRIHID